MRDAPGVGLAAPQVGLNLRLFVINPTGNPEDDRVYVNPILSDPDGGDEKEEGCLSLPEVNVNIANRLAPTAEGPAATPWSHDAEGVRGPGGSARARPPDRPCQRSRTVGPATEGGRPAGEDVGGVLGGT